ncbi:MAG TPA: hypothetical protein VIK55_11115 [Paludibacter sp.]
MYDFINQYANIMYNRNLKSFGTIVIVNDIINEVYAIGFNSKEDVIKKVRDIIFKEKRRIIASQQQRSSRNVIGEKICNKCNKSKSFSEFYKRFDKRNGFRYLCNNCMECEIIRRSEYNSRKRNEKKKELVQYDLQY